MPKTAKPELDRTVELADRRHHFRYYDCPKGEFDAERPAMGALLTGHTTPLGARVIRVNRRQQPTPGALDLMEVVYEEFRAYA